MRKLTNQQLPLQGAGGLLFRIMPRPIYNSKITRATDWGGDASTGNVPVSGARVQEYIKEEITSLDEGKADKAMFVVMSDTQYDALATKDPDTFYYIYED